MVYVFKYLLIILFLLSYNYFNVLYLHSYNNFCKLSHLLSRSRRVQLTKESVNIKNLKIVIFIAKQHLWHLFSDNLEIF